MKAVLLALTGVLWAGCTGHDKTPCGLPAGTPDVPSGTLRATWDGNAYVADTNLRGYRLVNNATNILAGAVDLEVGKDTSGNNVSDLISQGKFPICVSLNDQSDGTTYASLQKGSSSYLTDSSHTGTVAILAKDGDDLIGRFEIEAVQQGGGGGTTKLEDGAFRLGPR